MCGCGCGRECECECEHTHTHTQLSWERAEGQIVAKEQSCTRESVHTHIAFPRTLGYASASAPWCATAARISGSAKPKADRWFVMNCWLQRISHNAPCPGQLSTFSLSHQFAICLFPPCCRTDAAMARLGLAAAHQRDGFNATLRAACPVRATVPYSTGIRTGTTPRTAGLQTSDWEN